MENTTIDLDSIVNYLAEYSMRLKNIKQSRDSLTALCPFHSDKNASLSVDLKHGKYKCFACGAEGNFTKFVAEQDGIDTKEAYKRICEKYGISLEHEAKAPAVYTLAMYSAAKKLPFEYLKNNWHMAEGKEKDGTPFLWLPYYGEGGEKVLNRKRYDAHNKSKRFAWAKGAEGKLILYGEEFIGACKNKGYAVLVEGESDTQTLVYLGIPALGVPGATTFRPEWVQKLNNIGRLYLHIEPDHGGETFREAMIKKLYEGGYKGEVLTWTCDSVGCKDPSDVLIKYGETAKDKIELVLGTAVKVNIQEEAEALPELIPNAPVKLKCPTGWEISEKGIFQLGSDGVNAFLICRTPILIARRLRKINGFGEEKVELCFYRDKRWQSAVYPRSTAFTARGITAFADRGVIVTSENAKKIVQYLQALEEENIERIPMTETTESYGWLRNDKFLPGHAPDIIPDFEGTMLQWANAFTTSGDYDIWKQGMAKARSASNRFRFIFSASLAAPLLEITRVRNFMVYNWGDSKDGKTAALKGALSCWGDPEGLVQNFNATQVALERMAALYKDLPLGIDERQLAGQKQDWLEKVVYMLSTGRGRARGAKDGKMQATLTWRTIALATGEEPINDDSSQTGVSTRTVEIKDGPFKGKEADAAAMYKLIADNYGFAGPDFVSHIIDGGVDVVKKAYAKISSVVEMLTEENGKEGFSNEGALIAVVATADYLASQWIFNEADQVAMANTIAMSADIISMNRENASRDVNETATEFIMDWIASNEGCFDPQNKYQIYGKFDTYKNHCYIFPSVLRKVLKDNGFSATKTLKYMAEKKYIETEYDGGLRYQVKIPWDNDNTYKRMIAVKLKEIDKNSKNGAK